ncbi:MAG TPA: L-seryl-tRNA(Sec) selenium transferase [Actinomycetota bacterium]|nr:L-seryl-tRNA(Sec) selenium transferase [Actinomycetota bacterium]
MAAPTRPGLRRRIPSVDALLRSEPGRRAMLTFGRPLLKQVIVEALADVRAAAASGTDPPADDVILARAMTRAAAAAAGLGPVLNATGVVLHTGLGRAPLPEDAVRAVVRAARGYSDLEVDRLSGMRGRRTSRAEVLLRAITGADAALVVNNGAAALLLAVATLARGKEVMVSRGELIEIGGEFRIPDILAASGAKLVEVGTTNRTRASDFRRALTQRTALVLKVHPSNYRIVGFTAAPSTEDLAAIAHRHGVPLLFDQGSGLLERAHGVPDDEPAATEALHAGADLVVCSGDKLLGGPQAGIVLGGDELVERMRRHPVARAVRVDKMQVAALEAVLRAYARGQQDELPTWRMLREPAETVRRRAERLSESLDGELEGAHVRPSTASVGAGSLPGHALASWAVEVTVPDPPAMAARLRAGRPSVFCRVNDTAVVFDVRTVTDDELPDLRRAIQYALEGDDLADE